MLQKTPEIYRDDVHQTDMDRKFFTRVKRARYAPLNDASTRPVARVIVWAPLDLLVRWHVQELDLRRASHADWTRRAVALAHNRRRGETKFWADWKDHLSKLPTLDFEVLPAMLEAMDPTAYDWVADDVRRIHDDYFYTTLPAAQSAATFIQACWRAFTARRRVLGCLGREGCRERPCTL